jgi:hypothetical protein
VNRVTACACEGEIAESRKDQSKRHKVAWVAAIRPRAHEELPNAIGYCGYREQISDLPFAITKRLSYLFGDNREIISDQVENGVSNKRGFHNLPSQPRIDSLDLLFGKPGNMRGRPEEWKIPSHEKPHCIYND